MTPKRRTIAKCDTIGGSTPDPKDQVGGGLSDINCRPCPPTPDLEDSVGGTFPPAGVLSRFRPDTFGVCASAAQRLWCLILERRSAADAS